MKATMSDGCWMIFDYDDGNALKAKGLASYMSGFGMTIHYTVAEALNPAAKDAGWDSEIEFTSEDVDRVAEMIREAQAKREAAKAATRMIRCDCGHTVASNLVMSASTGTSCPDCYDRMSE